MMHHSQLEYLVAIQNLQRQDRGAKGYEVAEYLNVSPAYAVKLNVYAESQGYILRDMAEDGTLTELSADGYGRYMKFDSDKTGTFIVCIPGVAFVMPMWGYAVILIACVLVVAAAITVTVVLVRRKKKSKDTQ